MANFDFLLQNERYKLFSAAAVDAERTYAVSPALCATGCRKALELGVKWLYTAEGLQVPLPDTLQARIHDAAFMNKVDESVQQCLQPVIRLGNVAVHSDQQIYAGDALSSLHELFAFLDWIDFTYGSNYPASPRMFNDNAIPSAPAGREEPDSRSQSDDLQQIERLNAQLAAQAAQLAAMRKQNEKKRPAYTEAHTREIRRGSVTFKTVAGLSEKLKQCVQDGTNELTVQAQNNWLHMLCMQDNKLMKVLLIREGFTCFSITRAEGTLIIGGMRPEAE